MDVVIVDDTPINITLMQGLVTRLGGCKPTCFTSPEEGLAHCIAEDPDLIIVDYMMPVMDGIEFIERIRSVPERVNTPMLMVTADHEKAVRYRALEAGATDFLTKPVDRMEFSARVRNMLGLRQQHVSLKDQAHVLAREVKKATELIYHREQETILRLAKAAEFRDPETGAHIQRMANFSLLIAQGLGLGEEFEHMILHAAPMHDVGKLGTPDHILLKPGRLTPEEFEIMKQHSSIGYEILKDSASPVLQMAARIALTHHEKFDGSGYPAGQAGEVIPIEGRIVAVADVFDALTSERPYKKAWPLEEARAFLESGRAQHFDPACVDAFLAGWDEVLAVRDRYQDS